jgi:GNAT superfamily N-acetyltransferase
VAYKQPELLGKHHRFGEFDSGEPALDDWLKKHSISAQASGSARVYVTTLDDGETVVGYYALNAAAVEPESATERVKKGQPAERQVPAILLSRLAVDSGHQGVGLGRALLMDALLRCAEAAEIVGARVLLVHAKHEQAKSFYMQYDFEESPTDPLHLLLLMKDLRATLKSSGLA